jgi:hypothetical protein
MKKYTCNICGKSYDDLCDYINCVSKCGEEAKKNYELKQMNKELYKIKSTKAHIEKLLENFKIKYPKEYELNFGSTPCDECEDNCPCEGENEDCACRIKHNCKGDGSCEEASEDTCGDNVKVIEVSYENNGKDKPTLSAKVNGTNVDKDSVEKLFEDPEVNYFARLLGIL